MYDCHHVYHFNCTMDKKLTKNVGTVKDLLPVTSNDYWRCQNLLLLKKMTQTLCERPTHVCLKNCHFCGSSEKDFWTQLYIFQSIVKNNNLYTYFFEIKYIISMKMCCVFISAKMFFPK